MATPQPASKVRLAVLDESTAAQLRASAEDDLEIVWSGTSAASLRAARPQVDVLLLGLDHLGTNPVGAVEQLVEATGAELAITLYAYAKRELLDRLSSPRIRALRGPLNIPTLRCQMLSVIARNMLGSGPASSPASSSASSGSPAITAPRYTTTQLGQLQQISTAIECECPNQLATLLQNLMDFEDYSKRCTSENEADAAIHRMLYETTARARGLIERGMDRLIEHENIVLS